MSDLVFPQKPDSLREIFGVPKPIIGMVHLRPLPGAPASCPLRWDEVTARLDPGKLTIRTIPERFEKMPDPVVDVFGPGVDVASTISAIARRMKKKGK